MHVHRNPYAAADLIRQVREYDGDERLPGVHVSDLIYCLRKSWARQLGVVSELSDITTLMFLQGKALHGRMELAEGETLVQVDGVHGSIDRVEQEEGQPPLPCEIKTTYASAAREITHMPHYFDQLGAYCAMLGVTRGRLYVLYINGIYARNRKNVPPELRERLLEFGYDYDSRPMLFAYDVEFSAGETAAHWRELLRRRDILSGAVAAARQAGLSPRQLLHLAPPLEEHWAWECEYCPVKDIIGCPGGGGAWTGSFVKDLPERIRLV